MNDVLVTGRGVVSSLGEGADELFGALITGRSGIRDGLGACSGFEPERWMSAKEARRTDRFAQFALAAAVQAATEAGLAPEGAGGAPAGIEPSRLGVILGTGVGGLSTLQSECEAFLSGGERAVSPNFVPMMMPNAAAGVVAMRLGAHGPGFSVSSACATGAHALGEAARLLERGEADAVVAGGTEAALTSLCLAAFRRMGALSRAGISRPFDARRDGFVMGEGAGILVLEELEAAQARGATILGEVAGYGATADAYHLTAPEPTGAPAARAIELALADAGLTPTEVDYVNAHGTSTQLNDAETAALKRALGDEQARRIPISSTKSTIGHLLGAAGAAEAVATVETLRTRVIPPTLGYEVPDPELDLDYVPGEARPLILSNGHPPAAISNSFAFGGHNVTLVIRGAEA